MKNQFFLTKQILVSNFRRVSFPYKLNFCLTYKCNSKCLSCDIWKIKSVNELRTDEIRKFFKYSNKFSWIDVTGGEVFLRKDIVEIADIILQSCKDLYHLHIPTNSIVTQLTVDKIKEILKLSPKPNKFTITLSIDGPPEHHDHIRGVDNNFSSVMKAFNELRKYENKNFKIFFGFTLSGLNSGKFNETVSAVKKEFPEVHYEDFHMNIAHTSGHYYNNSNFEIGMKDKEDKFIKEVEEFRLRKKNILNPINNLENKYLTLAKEYIKSGITPIDCKSLSSSVFLDPYGNVFPCSIWDKKIGNIKDFEYDLIKLLEQQKVHELRQTISEKKCPNCWTPCEAYQSILASLFRFK
ncbi:MAG: radical SAM protein [Ignavibacteria bacterium]|nr:radical SAM protein [Ignavibacteria bacterium]MBT8381594.1 radical SAM protein [Ignavibacteria bacterium]MBT8391985.1 radical SAM protein [Ignavibacteria bacterium]NNJ53155.1 radical SAM protein [Ignavibacteriaceae bacterium]NNL21046.1 radical SAM protein [Ignavibacteriaceae bacterium]